MSILQNYRALDYALLRMPAFSLDHYLTILDKAEQTKQRLCDFFSDDFARNALVHLAPEFWARVQGRIDTGDIDDADTATLLRYANRLCFRTTPYGLSATVSALRCAPGILPAIGPRADIRYDAGLDDVALTALIESEHEEDGKHKWLANDTTYEFNGALRFVKLAQGSANSSPMLAVAQITPWLASVLAFAATPKSAAQIINHLKTQFPDDELTEADCDGYIRQLVAEQLLTKDHLYSLTDVLQVQAEVAHLFPATWAAIDEQLSALTHRRADVATTISAIKSSLGSVADNLGDRAIVRVDSWRDLPDEAGIPASLLREIDAAMRIMAAMTQPEPGGFQLMLERWETRYGDADIPLMVAVDEANGLYADDARNEGGMIANLPGRRPATSRPPGILRDKLLQAYHPETGEIVLSDAEITQFCKLADSANPTTITGWFRFFRCAHDDDFTIGLLGFGAWPVGRLMGRFCNAEPKLLHAVKGASCVANSLDTVLAELVCHPRGRIGNVCKRPVLSDYEVTIRTGAATGIPTLALSDLVVCRDGNKLRLRSISLGKWVDLRFSTAHNHELRSNLKLYRFLVALVGQSIPAFGEIFPRTHLYDMIRAPRVKLGRIILAPATWRLGKTQLEQLKKAKSDQQLLELAQEFRSRFDLPEWVVHAQADNELLLCLSNMVCLRELQTIGKNAEELYLKEFMPPGCSLATTGADGSYNNECLITYSRPETPWGSNPALRVAIGNKPSENSAKVYGPGSEWLYFRLAVQPVFQDALLLRMWNELVSPLQNNGNIDGAFYVRYSDQQGQHLRVRIHAASAAGRAAMILACNHWLDQETDKGTCADARMETYAPEWNRYGGVASMSHVHTIFATSTMLAMSVIAAKDRKVQLALWTVDAILTALGLLSPQQKLEFARKHARGFANEYDMTPKIRKQVADLANQAGDLAALRLQFGDVARLHDAIGEVTRAGAALADLAALDQLCTPLADIHSSVLHMHLNRLFAENPRAQEAVFWDVLRRMYERHCALYPS